MAEKTILYCDCCGEKIGPAGSNNHRICATIGRHFDGVETGNDTVMVDLCAKCLTTALNAELKLKSFSDAEMWVKKWKRK